MSPRALRTLRSSSQEWMVDDIEIWRPSTSTLDDDTLVESSVPSLKVWSGPCRISPSRGPNEQAVSEGVMVLRDADFLIPVTAFLPHRDDEVKVVDSGDPALVGRWFVITDVRVFSQQATRRFSGLQKQPSRTWTPS